MEVFQVPKQKVSLNNCKLVSSSLLGTRHSPESAVDTAAIYDKSEFNVKNTCYREVGDVA